VIIIRSCAKGNGNSPFEKIRVFEWVYSGNSQKKKQAELLVEINLYCSLFVEYLMTLNQLRDYAWYSFQSSSNSDRHNEDIKRRQFVMLEQKAKEIVT
jgi:hypothetical protein